MIVGIDGSTYKYHPFYHFWVTEKLSDIVDPGLEVRSLSVNSLLIHLKIDTKKMLSIIH